MLRGALHGNCWAGRRIKGYALAVLILSHCPRGWEHRGCPCAPPVGWKDIQLLPDRVGVTSALAAETALLWGQNPLCLPKPARGHPQH